jgi:hypothetical protein
VTQRHRRAWQKQESIVASVRAGVTGADFAVRFAQLGVSQQLRVSPISISAGDDLLLQQVHGAIHGFFCFQASCQSAVSPIKKGRCRLVVGL